MKRKIFTIMVCLLLMAVIVPVMPAYAATTWYVDDSGGADFLTIQEAVDAAGSGDTIIVKDGTYTENIMVSVDGLTIQSENGADTTIVQAQSSEVDVIFIDADNVIIDGFTTQGCTEELYGGITLYSDDEVTGCEIRNNDCSNNDCGIVLINANNNTIESNVAGNCYFGIYLQDSAGNLITNNSFSDNAHGIGLAMASSNTLYMNNFMNNAVSHVLDDNDPPGSGPANFWNSPVSVDYSYNSVSYNGYVGNYWDDYSGTDADGNGIGDTPYSTVGTDADDYPLMAAFENYEEEPLTGSSSLTAVTNIVVSTVGIEVSPNGIDYGNVIPGENSTVETVNITNTGTLDIYVTLQVQGSDTTAQDFYEQSLYIDGSPYNLSTVIASIPSPGSDNIDTQLQVPASWAEPGVQEATFIFWAEATT